MLLERMLELKFVKNLQEKKKSFRFQESTFSNKLIHIKNQKLEEMSQLITSCKDMYKQTSFSFQTVEGLFLWEVNRKLNQISRSGIPKKDLEKGKITIALSRKRSTDSVNAKQKASIEKMVQQLEGFENLKLSSFYQYKPVYKEKKVFNHVTRWLEIEIL